MKKPIVVATREPPRVNRLLAVLAEWLQINDVITKDFSADSQGAAQVVFCPTGDDLQFGFSANIPKSKADCPFGTSWPGLPEQTTSIGYLGQRSNSECIRAILKCSYRRRVKLSRWQLGGFQIWDIAASGSSRVTGVAIKRALTLVLRVNQSCSDGQRQSRALNRLMNTGVANLNRFLL